MSVITLPNGTARRTPRELPQLPPILLPCLLAVGTFAVSLAGQFVYDDVYIIVENESLHSLSNIGAILGSSWWPDALYRPLTQLSFAIDWALSGGSPMFFHAVNLIAHVIATLLVFRLASSFIGKGAALIAASLFAVHPVHVEAVANVVGRAEVFATVFTLAATLLYRWDGTLADREEKRLRWLAQGGVFIFALMAYASKESALELPGILFLVDWLDSRESNRRLDATIKRHAVLLFSTFALAVEWMALRSVLLGGLAGDHPGPGVFGEDLWGRATAMAPVVIEWARLLVFPLHLSADYSPDYLKPGWHLQGVAGVTLVLSLAVIGFRLRKRFPTVAFGLAWLGGTLFVISNLLVPTGVLMAERSLYLPSVGFCLLVGWALSRPRAMRPATNVGLAIVVGLMVARSVERVGVWESPTTFFPRLVQDARGSFRAYWVAGAISYQMGDREMGERLMRSAIAIYPIFPNVWNSLATELEREERWDEAGDYFAAAFRIDSTRVGDAVSAVSNYIRADRLDSASAVIARAYESGSDDFRLTVLEADVAMRRGRPLTAMTLRRQVSFRMPTVWQYWYLTAEAAARADYCPEALRSMERVRSLFPDFEDTLGVEDIMEERSCR